MSQKRQLKVKEILIYSLLLTAITLPFQNCSRNGFDSVAQSSTDPHGPTSSQSSRSVKIAWDKSASTNIQGYKIYLGTKAGIYDKSIDAGPTPNPEAPQFEITDLDLKTSYFVVVKAYDQSSESISSNELQLPAQ